MTAYVISSLQGSQYEIEAASVPEALRIFSQDNPGQHVLSITPAVLQRAADQQT